MLPHKLGPNTPIYNRPRSAFGPVLKDEKIFEEMYNTLFLNRWRAEELERDLSSDERIWSSVDPGIKLMLTNILAFFLHADDIVGDMAVMFSKMIDNPVISGLLIEQAANEFVHQRSYFLMAQKIFKKNDPETFERIHKSKEIFKKSTAYVKKLEWAKQWIHPRENEEGKLEWPHPCEQLIAFGMTEGVLFASSFAGIFFAKSLQGARKCDVHGIYLGNKLVMQDENCHFTNTANMFKKLVPEDRISVERIHEIIRSAVETEDEFVDETIPGKPENENESTEDSIPMEILGLSRENMKKYVRWVANRYTMLLGIDPVYTFVKRHPLNFMNQLWFHERNNPFERKGPQYAHHIESSLSNSTGSNTSVDSLFGGYHTDKEWADDDDESASTSSDNDTEEEDRKEFVSNKEILDLCLTFPHLGLSKDF